MSAFDKIITLTKQLYPTGRAFRVAVDSFKLRLHEALAISEAQAYTDALSTLNSALPDNDDFDLDDAAAWEHRLGLITNAAVALSSRRAAIIRKMNHPGTIPARQHYLYLESQLQAAGFDVYVHENRFPLGGGAYETQTPEEVTGDTPVAIQYNDVQYGDAQYGGGQWNLIANHLDETLDASFNIGSNLKSTFFIGGPYVGDYVQVDQNRKLEFRQLILRIKPVQSVGYLFVDYVSTGSEDDGSGFPYSFPFSF